MLSHGLAPPVPGWLPDEVVSAVLLAVEGDVSKSYYCRTAPAYNDTKTPPTKGMCKGLIVAHMFFLYTDLEF